MNKLNTSVSFYQFLSINQVKKNTVKWLILTEYSSVAEPTSQAQFSTHSGACLQKSSGKIYTCFVAELTSVLCAIMKPDTLLLVVNKHEVSKTKRRLSGIPPFCRGYSSFSTATECSLSKIRQLLKFGIDNKIKILLTNNKHALHSTTSH